MDPEQVAAALRNKLMGAGGWAAPPVASAGLPIFSKAGPKPPPASLAPEEDLAAKLRRQLLNRPELQSALEEARRAQQSGPEAAEEAEPEEKKSEDDKEGKAAAEKDDEEAAEEEEEEEEEAEGDSGPWPPEAVRFNQEALGAAADAARQQPEDEDPDILVEAAAIAALESMRKQGKLPAEATIPEPQAASKKAAAAAAAEKKQAAEATAEAAAEAATAAAAEAAERAKQEEEEEEEANASPPSPSPPSPEANAPPQAVEQAFVSQKASAPPPPPSGPLAPPPGMANDGAAAAAAMLGGQVPAQHLLLPMQMGAPMQQTGYGAAIMQPKAPPLAQPWGMPFAAPLASPVAPAPMVGFIAKVEEGLKGERIFRYSLGPGADIEGCFRNVRRRIEVELEDGLTVQMCLQKRLLATA